MKRYALPALFLSALLAVCGCAAGKSADSAEYAQAAPAAAPEAAVYASETAVYDNAASSTAQQPADAGMRKIVYTAYLELTADDPAAALEAVTQKAIALGGYVAASNSYNDEEGAYRSSATLKVPAALLDALVSAAESAGTVDSYSLNSDDISLSYYDIQARLGSARAEETQLLEILAGCETVEELLAVRAELSAVRGDIESYQAQINLWDNLVDYATLELGVRRTQKTPVAGEGSLIEIWKASDVWKNIQRGFGNSARFIVNAIGAIGIFLAYALIPAAVLFCCIGIPIIVHRKRKKRRAAEQGSTPPQV